jgi:hypothetical protein
VPTRGFPVRARDSSLRPRHRPDLAMNRSANWLYITQGRPGCDRRDNRRAKHGNGHSFHGRAVGRFTI